MEMSTETSKQEANKQIVVEHFRLMSEARFLDALKDFAPDAEWWVIGHGVHGGSNSMQDLIAAYSGPVPQYFPNGNPINLTLLVAEGDWVVAEGVGQGPVITGAGKPYQNQYVWLFKIVDGKVRIFKEYFDTLHAEERIFGRKLVDG